jgi:hypothetical protein
MGHGDEIVVADANFPSASNARRLVDLPGTRSGGRRHGARLVSAAEPGNATAGPVLGRDGP